jgi:hypothetical protein
VPPLATASDTDGAVPPLATASDADGAVPPLHLLTAAPKRVYQSVTRMPTLVKLLVEYDEAERARVFASSQVQVSCNPNPNPNPNPNYR